MKLNVPRFKQQRITCGPSSLKQVLSYYGKNIPLNDMLKEIEMTKYGTWMSNLAIYAENLGYKTKIITFDTNILDPTWIGLPKKKLIRKLKLRFKTIKNKEHEPLAEYLENGGTLEIKIPTKEMLINYLNKGIPPIISLSCTSLWKTIRRVPDTLKSTDIKGKHIGHYLTVNGYENGKFLIVDSHWKHSKKGIYKVSVNDLLFAWYFWGGWLLIIEKVNK